MFEERIRILRVCVCVAGQMLSGGRKASSWLIAAAESHLKPPDQAGMCSVFVPCWLAGHTSFFPLVPLVLFFQCHKKSICLLWWVWSLTEPLLFSCLSISTWAYLSCLQSRSPLSRVMAILIGLGFQPQVRGSSRGCVLCRDENQQASSDPSPDCLLFFSWRVISSECLLSPFFVFLGINFL